MARDERDEQNHKDEGRDEQGRFAIGNAGGPGRPPKSTEELYLQSFTSTVSEKQFEMICQRAVQQAIEGDKDARRFVASYALGAPIKR